MTYVKIKITEHSKEAVSSKKEFEGKDLSAKQVSELITAFSQSITTHLVETHLSEYVEPLRCFGSPLEECSCTEDSALPSAKPDDEPDYIQHDSPPIYPLMEKTEQEIEQKDLQETILLFQNPYQPEDPSIQEDIAKDLTEKEQLELRRFMNPESFGINIGDKIKEALDKAKSSKASSKAVTPLQASPKVEPKTPHIESDNTYLETGIKYYETPGFPKVPRYKCRYHCPRNSCGTRSTHYIREGQQHVYCYNCNEKIKVEDASDIGFPNRDSWGNYYVANISREELI